MNEIFLKNMQDDKLKEFIENAKSELFSQSILSEEVNSEKGLETELFDNIHNIDVLNPDIPQLDPDLEIADVYGPYIEDDIFTEPFPSNPSSDDNAFIDDILSTVYGPEPY